jgi:hypothetical protein
VRALRRWAFATLLLAPVGVRAEEPALPSEEELFAQIRQGRIESKAVEALAVRPTTDSIVRTARERLAASTDLHVRIALGYVLASHGEKAGLEVLVESLNRTGHFGYIYLTRAEDQRIGWDVKAWTDWLAGFTEEEYRSRVARRRLPSEVREGGAKEFLAAARFLRDGGDRATAASRFRETAAAFPRADAVADALELADLLEAQAREDSAGVASGEDASLPLDRRVARWVHLLRDARCVDRFFEQYCSFLAAAETPGGAWTPAIALRNVGRAVVPVLLPLLEDRRPTRALATSNRRHQDWVVLRYQDVALELLNDLLPVPPTTGRWTHRYLSDLEPRDRRRTIDEVRAWARQTVEKARTAR